MAVEHPYCLIIGRPSPAQHRLERLLQPRFAIVAAENEDAAVFAATVFHPDLVVIQEEAVERFCELSRRLEAVRPGITVVRHLGNNEAAIPADPAIPDMTVSAAGKLTEASIIVTRTQMEDCMNGGQRQVDDHDGGSIRITPREREVLTLLLRGRSMKETARLLSISPRTVAFHKYHAMASNGLQTNADLLGFAVREGILSLSAARQEDAAAGDVSEQQGAGPGPLPPLLT